MDLHVFWGPLVSILEKLMSGALSPILFELGILNLASVYILGLQSVTHCFHITVTLTPGLSSSNILSLGAFVTL